MCVHALLAIMILSFVGLAGSTASGASISRITVDHLGLYDTKGERVQQVQLGQQVSIRASITNQIDSELSYVLLIEIRDGSGITGYIGWQGGTIKPNANYTFETSWIPDAICWAYNPGCDTNYQIRSFAISGFDNPQLWTIVEPLEGIAVTGTVREGDKVYQLLHGGKEYNVEYSVDGGSIARIRYIPATSNIQIQTVLVRDSVLTIAIPREVIDETFACGKPVTVGSEVEAEVFVDTIPSIGIRETITADSRTWHIQLKAGTEEIEIVGACTL